MSGGTHLTKQDGPHQVQAGISSQINLAPVPTVETDPSVACYPLGMGSNYNLANTVLRGQPVFIVEGSHGRTTESGVEGAYGITSFANRPKCRPGEDEEFFMNYTLVGLIKNNYTNPADGGATASGGGVRPNSLNAATQLGGSSDFLVVAGRHPIKAGDLTIITPPDPDAKFDGNNEGNLPIAGVEALHWTRYMGQHCAKLNAVTLERQAMMSADHPPLDANPESFHNTYSDFANSFWHQAALANKTDKLLNGMSAIMIGEKKGHLEITTPSRSWARAQQDALVDKLLTAKRTGGAGFAAEVTNLLESFTDEMRDGMDVHNAYQRSNNRDNVGFVYDSVEKVVKGVQLGNASLEKYRHDLHTTYRHLSGKQSVAVTNESDEACAIEIRRLGLGESGSNEELPWDVLEILALCCYSDLDPRTTAPLWMPGEGLSGSDAFSVDYAKTFKTFIQHLSNGTSKSAACAMEIRHALHNRVLGKAQSCANAVKEGMEADMRGRPADLKVIDITLGTSFV